jgi:hypothetical protein
MIHVEILDAATPQQGTSGPSRHVLPEILEYDQALSAQRGPATAALGRRVRQGQSRLKNDRWHVCEYVACACAGRRMWGMVHTHGVSARQ